MALIYDALVIVALLLVAAIIAVLVATAIFGQKAVTQDHIMWGSYLLKIYYLAIWWGYYHVSWRNGGQTLGMRAWHLYTLNHDGHYLSLRQSLLRFITALGGLGLVLIPFSATHQALQDRLSNSMTVRILSEKEENA